ncbi:MAG: hypothetical protein WBA13_01615 [Microcoleaceae cyanobacterium]
MTHSLVASLTLTNPLSHRTSQNCTTCWAVNLTPQQLLGLGFLPRIARVDSGMSPENTWV